MTAAVAAVMAAQKITAGGGNITFVQSKYMVTNAFGTVHTMTPDSGITAGNTVILAMAVSTSTLPIVSFTTNTAVSLTSVGSFDNGSGTTTYIYRLTNAGSGVTSFILTITGANAGTMHLVEVSGAVTASPVDVTNTGTNGFETGPHDDVTVTTTVANDAVFALFRCDGRDLVGPSSGYTSLPASGTAIDTYLTYNLDVGATGVQAPGITFTAGAGTSVVVAAIKKA